MYLHKTVQSLQGQVCFLAIPLWVLSEIVACLLTEGRKIPKAGIYGADYVLLTKAS